VVFVLDDFTKSDKSIFLWFLIAVMIYFIYAQEFVIATAIFILWFFLRFYWKSYFKKDK
jgi:hypothetical protein